MTDEIWYPVCPLCEQPIFNEHDAYEIQVTYLGWKERTNKWFVCVSCFENTEACKIFNIATNFLADRRVRPPPYQLRKVLRWYVQDVTRDLIRFLVRRRKTKRQPASTEPTF